MTNKKRQRREYLRLLDKAKEAAECAIDNFNRTRGAFKTESTLMLLGVAWELLAKSILVAKKENIRKPKSEDSISAEIAISRLLSLKLIEQHHFDVTQQIISLRNASVHDVLPEIPIEVQHHLMYYACKFFREVVSMHFKGHVNDLSQHHLSLSFSELTTYADKIQRCVSRVKQSSTDRQLVWLLERGVSFDGSHYMTQKQFETSIKGKKRTLPYLQLGKYIKDADMVRIVPVEAPKNYTANITLRKGSSRDSSLPVITKRTELEKDYPYLTKELAEKLGRTTNFIAKSITVLGLKGNEKYHQSIRSSKSGEIQRYSESAFAELRRVIESDKSFNPYKS